MQGVQMEKIACVFIEISRRSACTDRSCAVHITKMVNSRPTMTYAFSFLDSSFLSIQHCRYDWSFPHVRSLRRIAAIARTRGTKAVVRYTISDFDGVCHKEAIYILKINFMGQL